MERHPQSQVWDKVFLKLENVSKPKRSVYEFQALIESLALRLNMGGGHKTTDTFWIWRPYNKDYGILGSVLTFPCVRKLLYHICSTLSRSPYALDPAYMTPNK